MTKTSIEKYSTKSASIITRPTGGGHFDAHISIATITGNKVFVINDGTAKQLYQALAELFPVK